MTIMVGITGGIGSGKSTFSKQILKRKLLLLDSDEQVSKLYKKPKKFTGSWNFGPLSNETMSVKNVVDLLFNNLSFEKKILIKKGVFKEANLLKLNSNKSLKKLKWKNLWNMRKSIQETAKWYKGYLVKSDIKKITNYQIDEYLKLYD